MTPPRSVTYVCRAGSEARSPDASDGLASTRARESEIGWHCDLDGGFVNTREYDPASSVRWVTIAPVWAALLTGDPDAQGVGSPSDEIRDATPRVPHLWFRDDEDETPLQRFHVEVHVAPGAAED